MQECLSQDLSQEDKQICSEAYWMKFKVNMNVQRLESEDFLLIFSPRAPGSFNKLKDEEIVWSNAKANWNMI